MEAKIFDDIRDKNINRWALPTSFIYNGKDGYIDEKGNTHKMIKCAYFECDDFKSMSLNQIWERINVLATAYSGGSNFYVQCINGRKTFGIVVHQEGKLAVVYYID